MRLEVELTLGQRRFKYAISFEWPANLREARIVEEALWVDGNSIFSRDQAQIQLPGGNSFGLDWHVFALPVINERAGGRSIQDIKAFFSSMILIASIPATMTGFAAEASLELQPDASN